MPKAKLTNEQKRKKAEAYLKALANGRKQYIAADKLLDELLGSMEVGDEVELSGNRKVTLVDNFAEKNKAFKTVTIGRYSLEQGFTD